MMPPARMAKCQSVAPPVTSGKQTSFMYRTLMLLVGAALLAGCSVVGLRSGYEQPAYDMIERIDDNVEIRHYSSRLAVQTTIEKSGRGGRNEAFGRLFDYISGANQPRTEVAMTVPVEVDETGETIEMTAPVETAQSDGHGATMRFFLPAPYSLSTAPAPTDLRLSVVELSEVTVAVLRFGGSRDDASVERRRIELMQSLAGSSWHPAGEASSLF